MHARTPADTSDDDGTFPAPTTKESRRHALAVFYLCHSPPRAGRLARFRSACALAVVLT